MALSKRILQHEIYEPAEKIIAIYQEGIASPKKLLQVKEHIDKK